MTTVDGFQVSPELIKILKLWCPQSEQDKDSILTAYINSLNKIQDYLCRHVGDTELEELKQMGEMLEGIIFIKDEFVEISKILPIVKIE